MIDHGFDSHKLHKHLHPKWLEVFEKTVIGANGGNELLHIAQSSVSRCFFLNAGGEPGAKSQWCLRTD